MLYVQTVCILFWLSTLMTLGLAAVGEKVWDFAEWTWDNVVYRRRPG